MRFIKLAIISVFFLFIVITGVGLLFPSTVVVSRATDMVAPKDSIFAVMKDIGQWDKWIDGMRNKGVQVISPIKADLAGTKVSIDLAKDYVVESTWSGRKGTVQKATMRIFQDSTSSKAVVQWQFVEKLTWYPWDRLSSMMNDKIMGEQLEHNLSNLKKYMETNR